MPFYHVGSIKYYRFEALENQGLYHGVFTRHGGFSPTPWQSMNFGASVGDELPRVLQNRETALSALNLKPESVFELYQVHSSKIVITDRPLSPNEAHIKADAILTNRPNVTLMMRFADCVPILLFDPLNRAIGIVHAGWMGTVGQIAKKTLLGMIDNYGTNPNDVVAAIGPSIGPDHYSIGGEVLDRIYASFGEKAEQLISNHDGKSHLDLWKANQAILCEVGVKNIEISGICTCCNLNDWYSHRGEHGETGRFGVVFGLSQ